MAHESWDLKRKDPSLPSKKKLRQHTRSGASYSPKYKKFMELEREIDKDKKRYRERVVDPDTGEVVRDVDEHLDEHRGRGSAKEDPESRPSD